MKKFYLTYKTGYTLCNQLSWSHNRLIMNINEKISNISGYTEGNHLKNIVMFFCDFKKIKKQGNLTKNFLANLYKNIFSRSKQNMLTSGEIY